MTKQQAGVFEFGPFRIDSAERTLVRDGTLVPLPPKVFDTLLALVKNSGRLLRKDDLISLLWPDSFVEEATLARNISDLRKTLGEPLTGEKYIATVPKSGYRFVADVRRIDPPSQEIVLERRTRSTFVFEEQIEPAVRSIAVLPFQRLGKSDDNDFLGLGLADALITKLSNIRQIAVRPTRSVMGYAQTTVNAASAGRELGVEAVLDGSIQRSGERIRITIQLVDTSTENPLWAAKFDEKFTDVFSVEDSISDQVARALTLRLSGEEQKQLSKRYTENTDAFELYLRGRYYWNRRTNEGLEKSIQCFKKAIELDPNYSLAYAGLADAYTFLGDVGLTAIRPLDAFTTARQAALAAIELDETLSEGHTALAHIDMHCYRWAEARRAFDRAIELGPNYPHSRQLNAFYLAFNGQLKEAQAEIRRALRLDPLSLAITNDVGVIHYFAREYDEAIEWFQEALELSANFDRAHHWLGAAYEQKQSYDEAISHYGKSIDLSGNIESQASLAHAYAKNGYKAEATKIRNELLAESSVRYISPYDLAMIHLGLDEREHALSQLRRACEEHSGWMIYLTVDPRLDPIRSEPAFQAILKIVGFESEQRS